MVDLSGGYNLVVIVDFCEFCKLWRYQGRS